MSLSEARKTIRLQVEGALFECPILGQASFPPQLRLIPPASDPYSHLKVRAFSPEVKSFFASTVDNDVHCSYWDAFVAANPAHAQFTAAAGYRKVIRSKDAFMKSIKKCDVAPVKPSDELFAIALHYTKLMMAPYMAGSKVSDTVEFQPNTSPGIPWVRMGIKDKVNATLHPQFRHFMENNYTPVWAAMDKNEFLPNDDVDNGKVRTIFSPPTDFILKQKMFSTDQNERMKNACGHFDTFWPRYGFVKQYSGFHNLFTRHSEFDLHFTSDGSGWDRVFSVMEDVWEQRRFFLFGNEVSPPLFDYVKHSVINSHIALPDGLIVQALNIGNRSGSDTTTTDNCWGHVIMAFYLCLLIGMEKLNRILEYNEILANTLFSLFGDDNLGSLRSQFYKLEKGELKSYVLRAYAAFGVVVKPSQFNIVQGHDLTGLEFLGSTANLHEARYYPVPRMGKLFTSLTRVLESKDPEPVASCVQALFDLVSFTGKDPTCESMKNLLSDYAIYLLNDPDFSASIQPSTRESLGRVAILKVDEFLHFGFEKSL